MTQAAERSEGERFVRLIELTNLVLVLIATATTHLLAGTGEMLWGVIAGGLVAILNLRAMVFLGRRILTSTPDKRRLWVVLLSFKLAALCGIIWLLLNNLPLNSIGFLLGFSAFLPAALIATFIRTLERPNTPSAPTSHGDRRL